MEWDFRHEIQMYNDIITLILLLATKGPAMLSERAIYYTDMELC